MADHATVPDPVPAQSDCRVISYNVLYEGIGPDGHGWATRRESVVDELDRLSPDLIAFQEVWMNQFDHLQADLPEFSWIATREAPAHTPIAYRTDRFEVDQRGTFWLAPTEADPGTPAWDAAFQRLATYARFDHCSAGQSVTVMNVHLDHEGEQARREGVELARNRLAALASDGHFVLAGDFNCAPGDPAYRRATVDCEEWPSLADAATVSASVEGPSETYTGFPSEDFDPDNIDHVLVSDTLEVERTVTCVPPTEHRPSDHRPVLVDLAY